MHSIALHSPSWLDLEGRRSMYLNRNVTKRWPMEHQTPLTPVDFTPDFAMQNKSIPDIQAMQDKFDLSCGVLREMRSWESSALWPSAQSWPGRICFFDCFCSKMQANSIRVFCKLPVCFSCKLYPSPLRVLTVWKLESQSFLHNLSEDCKVAYIRMAATVIIAVVVRLCLVLSMFCWPLLAIVNRIPKEHRICNMRAVVMIV